MTVVNWSCCCGPGRTRPPVKLGRLQSSWGRTLCSHLISLLTAWDRLPSIPPSINPQRGSSVECFALPCKNQTYGSEKRICNCRRTTTRQCVCKASKAKLHRWIDLPAGRRRRRRRRTSEVTACSGWVNTSYAATLPIIPSVHRRSIYHR